MKYDYEFNLGCIYNTKYKGPGDQLFFSPNIASSDPKYSLGINVSYKKGNIISFKLQPILQREVSQKEKHQYSILTHIYGI